jgi:peptide/nickel transport system permease protein
MLVISFISFSLLQIMPGDPAAAMLGTNATKEQIDSLRKELWLDRPFLVQYGHWFSNALQGDMGMSIIYREPITRIFASRLPVTLYLSSLAFVLSTLLGITAGILCAIRRGGWLDQLISVCANIGMATPVFWLGILCIYLFGLKMGWLPIYGWTSPFDNWVQSSKQAILPVIMLAVPGISVLARQSRSSMLEVIRQDYIRTAFAKGLRESVVVARHALKNALIPLVTLMGLYVRILVGGSVLVETVFSIPGMGRLIVAGVLNKDFLVVQGGVLFVGAIVAVVNLLVDLSYVWLDPRVRYE